MEERIKVLLIEDNYADARLIELYLKEQYSNTCALTRSACLAEGLEQIKMKDFDIIIVDLSLPDSSGIDTFKEVYTFALEKPVLVLTGMEDEEIGISTVKMGAQDFLIKGKLNSRLLKRAIDYSIERFKMLNSLSEYSRMLEEQTANLQREKTRLAEAQKMAHIGSWEWNLQDQTFTCSDELYNVLGIEPIKEQLTFEMLFSFIHPADRERVDLTIKQAVENKSSFKLMHRIIRRDGFVRVLQVHGEVLPDRDGRAHIMTGTKQDVTEQKKEAELAELAMVATESYNAVTITNNEGKIVWVNQGFTKLFGYTLEDVKGTYGEILRRGQSTGLSPDSEFYATILKEKKPLSYESKNYAKDGNEYWVLTSLTPVINERGEVEKIISIDSDITKQKKAEQELIIANKISEHSLYKGNKALEELNKAKHQLEESLKVKEQFLANMSHEIRTPMNAIIGFTGLLLKSDISAENRQYLSAIKTSGENLLVIINDILDFTKLESGKINFENIRFGLHNLVSLVIELMLPKAIEKGNKLSLKIEKGIPNYIVGDPTRLNQILINLVGNAIKFTDKGEVKVSISVVSENNEYIQLKFSVSDTGIGIPEESLPRIFESFTQAANDTTRKYGGTGLGLTITKQLVEQQGGKVGVTSKLNEGSVFFFSLVFEKSSLQETNNVSNDHDQERESFPLKDVRVLLVEDNSFNQILATKILDNWKCCVEVAANGRIAVEKVAEGAFDLILMDIQLPEMDGYEATQCIRNQMGPPKCNIPIVAMTAHAFSDEKSKCLKAGMNDYISKPFDEDLLYTKILKALKKRRTDSRRYRVRPVKDFDKCQRVTDLSYMEKISNGDNEFMIKMIRVFINQTPGLIADFKKYFQRKDWNSMKIVMHKMRPSVVFMGMNQLDEIIRVIEDDIAGQLFIYQVPDLIKKMDKLCQLALCELEIEISNREKTDKGLAI